MGNLQKLRAGTINGAEAIGLSQDLGNLEPGKLADLVVLDKDPLQDIQNTVSILFVMVISTDILSETAPKRRIGSLDLTSSDSRGPHLWPSDTKPEFHELSALRQSGLIRLPARGDRYDLRPPS